MKPVGNPDGKILKKIGWSGHFFGYGIIDFPVIGSVFECIADRSFPDVQFSLEIYNEKIAVCAFAFEAAMECMELHPFKFHNGEIHFYKIRYLILYIVK